MKKNWHMFKKKLIVYISSIIILLNSSSIFACTRFVFHGLNDTVMTARSMDWKTNLNTKLWVFPRDLERNGSAGSNSISWKSKYGSVVISSYDMVTVDGLNEKGLNANLLWLSTSKYPEFKTTDKKTLSLSLWAQFILDNFSDVNEAVSALEKESFIVVSGDVPGQSRVAALHLSISDAKGDSAVIEYIDGKQVIHHSKNYQVVTNEPKYEDQLAITEYWKKIDGTKFLPGSNKASDRFVRASFYVNAIPKTDNYNQTFTSVLSIIRNVSVPYGISTENEPNISSTRWRNVVDHKNKLYFFESVSSPYIFWVDLNQIKFDALKEIKSLNVDDSITKQKYYSGDVTTQFKLAKPFIFEPANLY